MIHRTLADPRVVPLPLVFEGRGSAALFMSYNALRRFRERTGQSPFEAIQQLAKVVPDEKVIRVDQYLLVHFLWAALHFATSAAAPLAIDPSVTVDDIGDALHETLVDGHVGGDSFFLRELQFTDHVYDAFYAAGLLKRPAPMPEQEDATTDPLRPAAEPH